MRISRNATLLGAAFALLISTTATALERSGREHPVGASIGVFAGLGSGPAGGSTLGGEVALHLSRFLTLKADYAGWGTGIPAQNCITMPPDSHRCSVSGSSGFAGVLIHLPFDPLLHPYAGIARGRFTRSWLGDSTITSPAQATEAGLRVRLSRRTSVKLGGKWVRVDDEHYFEMLSERLEYSVGTVGFDLRVW
jgi:hypothetical protein